jgi:predicted nicotinamide N-methyase
MSVRVSYATHEFDNIDIHLRTLRSNQEFEDLDGIAASLGISSASWPLFGVVWPSGIVLANHLFRFDTTDKRILEVGCGIGLTSLLLNHLQADITATDYHPEAEAFLRYNARLNADSLVPFVRTGWGDAKTDLGEFDLIVGSDLLYEDEHSELLANFIVQHCKPTAEIIVVDPGRGNQGKFSRNLAAHGFALETSRPLATDNLPAFKGSILHFRR